jgi:AraC-like DNA-binding protein
VVEIPLLRVRYAKRLVDTLSERGYDANGLLRAAELDPEMLEIEDAWMPVSQLSRFIDVAVAETGYKTLGLDTGIKPRRQHSTFSRRVLYSPTLYRALLQVCDSIALEDISAKFRLTREGRDGWMRCVAVDASREAVRQIETYRFAAIVEIIRCAAGPEWLPATLRLQSDADPDIASADLLQGVDIDFGASGLSIAIEPALFSRRMLDVSNLPDRTSRFDTPPIYFPEAVREVVRTQVMARRSTFGSTAAALGIAPRTLQRQLAESDLSYSQLLEFVRIETAKHRLAKNGEPISAIANDLGYKQSTHFSRAFRRVCGLSPSEFRKYQSSLITYTPD